MEHIVSDELFERLTKFAIFISEYSAANPDFKIKIENPNLYQLKVCLTDHNQSNRSCQIKCEDIPTVDVRDMGKEKWVVLPITREHCLDQFVEVSIKCTGGPNVMIGRIVLSKNS